jgi:nicotinamidase-related amidase
MMQAVLVVDMIKEFVTGKLGFEGARAIVGNLRKLLDAARSHGIPVFYICDSHKPGDPELKIWGEHAMAGSESAEVIPDLTPQTGEPTLFKRTYSAFFETGLHETLQKKKIRELVVVGVVTDICIQHSVADALFRGYGAIVLEDCTAAIDERGHQSALDYMRRVYGAKVMQLSELMASWGAEG